MDLPSLGMVSRVVAWNMETHGEDLSRKDSILLISILLITRKLS
jgi:hypothetical protein